MQKDDKALHIYAYGYIYPDSSGKGQSGFVNLKDIKNQCDAQKDAEEIICHIHSEGGEVLEGFAIHDYLRSLGKPIKTVIEGKCCSIASVIALAGDTRVMTSNATFFIHNPWGVVCGDKDQLQKKTDELEKMENKVADFYASKTKITQEEALSLMKKKTAFTSEEALEKGFITEIEPVMKAVALFTPSTSLNDKELIQEFSKRIKKGKKMEFFKQFKNLMGFKASLELTTATGDIVDVLTDAQEPAIGDEINDKEGNLMPDGKHLMADGSSIVTADSKITEILSADKADAQAQNALIKEQGEAIMLMAKSLNKMQETLNNQQAEFTAFKRNVKSEDYQPPQAENTSRMMKVDDTDAVLAGVKQIRELKTEKNG